VHSRKKRWNIVEEERCEEDRSGVKIINIIK
jgi:hypothetical protein